MDGLEQIVEVTEPQQGDDDTVKAAFRVIEPPANTDDLLARFCEPRAADVDSAGGVLAMELEVVPLRIIVRARSEQMRLDLDGSVTVEDKSGNDIWRVCGTIEQDHITQGGIGLIDSGQLQSVLDRL
jgi:hypothetical protein